jgi:hypothetical protein
MESTQSRGQSGRAAGRVVGNATSKGNKRIDSDLGSIDETPDKGSEGTGSASEGFDITPPGVLSNVFFWNFVVKAPPFSMVRSKYPVSDPPLLPASTACPSRRMDVIL